MIMLSATVDRWEGDKAVLRLEEGQELVVDIKDLPKGTKEGSVLSLSFLLSPSQEQSRIETFRSLWQVIKH